MGVQASIGGAIGLAGRAARRLWALNSKGRLCQPLYRQPADYGPYRVPGLTSRYSHPTQPFLQPFVPLAQNWALGHFMPCCASTLFWQRRSKAGAGGGGEGGEGGGGGEGLHSKTKPVAAPQCLFLSLRSSLQHSTGD